MDSRAVEVFMEHSEELALSGQAVASGLNKVGEGLSYIGIALIAVVVLSFFKWVWGGKSG